MSESSSENSGSEITLTSPAGEEHKISKMPPGLVEAIFREATARTEQKSGTLHEPYDIKESDLLDLAHKMEQTLRTFQHSGYVFTFYLRTEDEKTDRIDSIDSFRKFDKGQTKPTSGFLIELTALIKTQDNEKFSQYKVGIEIFPTIMPSEQEDKTIPKSVRRFFRPPSIHYYIDYENYVVARTFVALFEEWASGLDRVPVGRSIKILEKFDFPAPFLMSRISLLFSTISAFGLIGYFDIASDIGRLPYWMCASTSIAIVMYIAGWASGRVYDHAAAIAFRPVLLNRTPGDVRNRKGFFKMQAKIRNKLIGSLVSWGTILILNILSGIILLKYF